MPALTASKLANKRLDRLNAMTCSLGLAGLLICAAPPAQASDARLDASTAVASVENSRMDGALFYQVLVSEIQARSGNPGAAYQIYLELARKHRNPDLFKRAVEIALQARSGDDALAAAKAWRQTLPQSRDAAESVVRIMLAMGRTTDLVDPLRTMIQLSPTPQQPQIIAALPRSLSRLPDRKIAAQIIDDATQPWRVRTPQLAEAWVASGEGWLSAKDTARALEASRKAEAIQPKSLGVGLLALNLMDSEPQAEDTVRRQLKLTDASPLLRLAYARKLAGAQRMTDSAQQLEILVEAQPNNAGSWLTLAAVRLELRQTDLAEGALKKFIALKEEERAKAAKTLVTSESPTPEQAQQTLADSDTSLDQGYLLMSQTEEQRGHWQKALDWLQRLENPKDNLLVQSHRARLLARQGKLAEGRAAIRAVPETEPRDALAKYQTEAQLLRDLKQWGEAYKVLSEASERFPQDPDLLYDRAMLAERLHKFDEMEQQLRKAIELKPDNAHAYNALGYSLADRNVRLDEARTLITKALSLRPGDPFITDSLGWLEFRSGHPAEALALLRGAYKERPDAEIAAHLGEVLWAQGERDEARRVWRKAQTLDTNNEALLETLTRLQVQP
ncbi:MAG: tetratricopeptide repeat protein [Burkholderiales bacterium]|nr:tetratricopeptide repeat protein [Burkholderiales bacterium]